MLVGLTRVTDSVCSECLFAWAEKICYRSL